MQLQQSAGNRAVGRWIAAGRVLQRQVGSDDYNAGVQDATTGSGESFPGPRIDDALEDYNAGFAAGQASGPHSGGDAPAPKVDDLDAAYQQAVGQGDWQTAAEQLNGFSRADIEARPAKLTPDQVAALHEGALANPRVGEGSQIAQMTAPSAAPASSDGPQSTQVGQLDADYAAAVSSGDWPTAAEKLNGFNVDDIQVRLARLSPEQIASLHQGALDNPRVGPGSQVAQMTDSHLPMGGGLEDYVNDPAYLDNFSTAAYDPLSNTLHLFYADGGEAVVPLPLASAGGVTLLVFERKTLLSSPGPNDEKIYPSTLTARTVPRAAGWVAEHAEEMQQSALLVQAGAGAIKARSLPPDLWWLALLAPAAGLGGRFLSMRMRPALGTEAEEGETPIIRSPTPLPPTPQAEVPSVRPRASVQQLREMIANSRDYFTYRTPEPDVAANQTIKFTGQNTPEFAGAPPQISLARGVKGLAYGSYAVVIKGSEYHIRPTADAAEFGLDGEIGATEGLWFTSEDYNAAKGSK